MPDLSGASCTNCGSPLRVGALFCATCGSRTEDANAAGLHSSSPSDDSHQQPQSPLVAPVGVAQSLPHNAPQPHGAQAFAPAAASKAPASTNRAIVIGVASALAAVLLVVAGIGVGAFFLNQNEAPTTAVAEPQPSTPADEHQSAQSDLEPVAAPALPSGNDTSAQAPSVPQPVPQNQSVQSVTIRSESGNLVCRYHMVDNSSPGVVCQQPNVNYALPSAACKAGASGMVIGLTAAGTSYPCLAENIKGGETLRYDTPYTHAGVTCTISYAYGLTCQNSKGRGFTMEYDAGVSTF